jgi:hypothetical protein
MISNISNHATNPDGAGQYILSLIVVLFARSSTFDLCFLRQLKREFVFSTCHKWETPVRLGAFHHFVILGFFQPKFDYPDR